MGKGNMPIIGYFFLSPQCFQPCSDQISFVVCHFLMSTSLQLFCLVMSQRAASLTNKGYLKKDRRRILEIDYVSMA